MHDALMSGPPMGRRGAAANEEIASRLDALAALLESQGASARRAERYRRAARAMRALGRPVREIVRVVGLPALVAMPGVDRGTAAAIREFVLTGHLALLERLSGDADPEALLAAIPGVGPRLARRLASDLEVDSLEALEHALAAGRLDALPGFGPRRVATLRDSVIGGVPGDDLPAPLVPPAAPPVEDLLDVDREYRERAPDLPHVAPRRLRPGAATWIPVLHTQRGDRHYTAMLSDTPHPHVLLRSDEWVVIHSDDERGERRATVVTETRGRWRGHRIVRDREAESIAHHASHAATR